MIANKQIIPKDIDVDHIDRDRTNDDPKNLRLRGIPDNRGDNWSPAIWKEIADFFETKSGGF